MPSASRLVLIAGLSLCLWACGPAAESPEPAAAPAEPVGPDRAALRERARALIPVLPDEAPNPENQITPQKIALGRALYYDTRLSIANDVSCNTCHLLDQYGVDGLPTSTGHEDQKGGRNAPTVYNAAFHIAQFWDGRAADVEEQAKGPVLNPIEMGMPDEAYVLRVLRSIPGYEPMFRAAFPGEDQPISYDNMARAIGAFERRLVTPSRFDAFLEGQDAALSDAEVAGLSTFLDFGCTACHNGVAVGGSSYQKLGAVVPYPSEDPGREAITGDPADRQVFKVPSLRNVAETGPWFHDGTVGALERAVALMAKHQLGREIAPGDAAAIVAFLGSLTGDVDLEYVEPPELPESGPETPTPEAS